MSAKTPQEALQDTIKTLNLKTDSAEYRDALLRNTMAKAIVAAEAKDALNQDESYKALVRKNKIAEARDALTVKAAIRMDTERDRLQGQLAAADAWAALTEVEKLKLKLHKAERAEALKADTEPVTKSAEPAIKAVA